MPKSKGLKGRGNRGLQPEFGSPYGDTLLSVPANARVASQHCTTLLQVIFSLASELAEYKPVKIP